MLSEKIYTDVKKNGIALMGHVVCGYPSFEANWEILEALSDAGASVVELQFPFTEPIADGPLFLEANQQSLIAGTTVAKCFDLMKRASQHFSFKVVMMGYYNTVFKIGEERFCDLVSQNGGTGLIVPDLPILEEGVKLDRLCIDRGLSLIRLVAPTNTDERIAQLLKSAQGFVYAVARLGVTGKETVFSEEVNAYLTKLHTLSTVPLAVGFGISKPEHIACLKGKADMAVLGSAVLRAYQLGGKKEVQLFLKKLLT